MSAKLKQHKKPHLVITTKAQLRLWLRPLNLLPQLGSKRTRRLLRTRLQRYYIFCACPSRRPLPHSLHRLGRSPLALEYDGRVHRWGFQDFETRDKRDTSIRIFPRLYISITVEMADTRPRPRPRPRPVQKSSATTAATSSSSTNTQTVLPQPGSSSSGNYSKATSIPLSSPNGPAKRIIVVEDTDEMFMRNRNRSSKTWQKLGQLDKSK